MEMYSSRDALDSIEKNEENKKIKNENPKKKAIVLFTISLCVISVGALIATTAFLLTRDVKNNESSPQCERTKKPENQKARELYAKIKAKYNELHPDPVLKNSGGVSTIDPFYLDFTPSLYKKRTVAAKELLKELETLAGNVALSKEEDLVFELFRRFLVNTFGTPYENNYEIGDWLLGPNIFCWQTSCGLLTSLGEALKQIEPKTIKDVELMVEFIKKCSDGYKQRIKNLRNGILAGIVLPDVACQAGLQNFKRIHVYVAKNGANGIFNESGIAELLDLNIIENIKEEEKLKWNRKHNVSIMKYLRNSMLNYVGKSLHEFLRYLEDDYFTHCPPSNITSGFASLPVNYIYTNGTPGNSTTKQLPDGEKFNGKDAYLILLAHFTTYNITPKEVDKLADQKLKELFPQVKKIAQAITKEKNEARAIEKFRSKLESDRYFYTIENETKYSEPYMRCYDNERAKKYCPERWKSMTRWLQSAKMNINRLRKKVHSAFYVKGEKQIQPACEVEVEFDFSPANPYHSYSEGSKKCTTELAKIHIPFFLEKPGPMYEEMTVMAHESYPGHHLEVQGVKEHFETECDHLRTWVSQRNYFAAFSEGWATYIEKDVADLDMNVYTDDMQRYGMLKHQILAALRAKVDVGVHYMGMKRWEAVSLYKEYALDTSDGIQKEITRLQSGPGQGTAYMIGQEKFSEYRRRAKEKLGKKFDVREFHYEILRQGELPMLYLGKQVDEYIQRKLNND